MEPAQRHLGLFLSEVRAQAPVPTLRSFLKLYTSLDAQKLANFLDADEEEMVQQMMVMKQASRSVSRVGDERGLLDGQVISTSDLDFVIDEVRARTCRPFRSCADRWVLLEHGAYRGVHCWAAVCRVVHPEHRACAACLRNSPKLLSPTCPLEARTSRRALRRDDISAGCPAYGRTKSCLG